MKLKSVRYGFRLCNKSDTKLSSRLHDRGFQQIYLYAYNFLPGKLLAPTSKLSSLVSIKLRRNGINGSSHVAISHEIPTTLKIDSFLNIFKTCKTIYRVEWMLHSRQKSIWLSYLYRQREERRSQSVGETLDRIRVIFEFHKNRPSYSSKKFSEVLYTTHSYLVFGLSVVRFLKTRKHRNSECYIPPSVPFRICLLYTTFIRSV